MVGLVNLGIVICFGGLAGGFLGFFCFLFFKFCKCNSPLLPLFIPTHFFLEGFYFSKCRYDFGVFELIIKSHNLDVSL